MRRTRLSLAAAGAALVVVSLGAGPALADGGDGDRTPEVVVGGLDAPRGLTVGWRGDLYVAQAGRGPAEGAGVGCIAGPEGPTCLGDTDKISRVDVRREKVYDVAKGLPSLAGEGGANAIGPSDVAFDRHGRAARHDRARRRPPALGRPPRSRNREADRAARLNQPGEPAPRQAGRVRRHRRLRGQEESRAGRDRHQPHHSLTFTRKHTVVADAGGNSLLGVRENGRIVTLATTAHSSR
ncbi:ScyD/ScyE family protein [Georgenia yuyongxinii]